MFVSVISHLIWFTKFTSANLQKTELKIRREIISLNVVRNFSLLEQSEHNVPFFLQTEKSVYVCVLVCV